MKIILNISIVFFAVFTTISYGSDFKRYRNVIKSTNDPLFKKQFERSISKDYHEGSNLIFDCKNMHYACVSMKDFRKCGSLRKRSLNQGVRVLKCAPLEKYIKKEDCFKKQSELVSRGDPKLLCINSR